MGFKPRIELNLLLMFFSLELLGSVTTNLLMFRTCYVIMGFNESDCASLGNSSTNENTLVKMVEQKVNIIDTARTMMEQIVGLTISLFLGQWSDKFGRKPILILAQTGAILSTIVMAIFSYFSHLSPWYFLFSSIPSMLTGGFSAFLVAVLAYISDTTTEETRGVRMAIMEGAFGAGILFGTSCSSYLLYATNYPSVYAISAGINCLGLVYTIFFIPESLENIDTEGKSLDIFEPYNVKDMFKVFTKQRPNYNKMIIILMTIILTLYIFVQNTGNKTYLFLMGKLNWNLTQYTWYNSVSTIFFIIGSIIGTFVLHKWLQITESVLVLMGLISEMNGFLVRGLATKSWHIYFSSVIKFLGGLISPQSRTLVAKLVPKDEIAKVFSLIMVTEFVVSIAASPVYTAIYNATVNTDPAIYNFFTAALCGLGVVFIIIVIILENVVPVNYIKLENEEEPVAINNSDLNIGF